MVDNIIPCTLNKIRGYLSRLAFIYPPPMCFGLVLVFEDTSISLVFHMMACGEYITVVLWIPKATHLTLSYVGQRALEHPIIQKKIPWTFLLTAPTMYVSRWWFIVSTSPFYIMYLLGSMIFMLWSKLYHHFIGNHSPTKIIQAHHDPDTFRRGCFAVLLQTCFPNGILAKKKLHASFQNLHILIISTRIAGSVHIASLKRKFQYYRKSLPKFDGP